MDVLTGRVAVITGGASGIGAAIADRLAAEGMFIVLGDIDPDLLAERCENLTAAGHEVAGAVTDVTDEASVQALAQFAVECFGGLHVAVNSAGIVNRGLTWELSRDEWQRVLDVNLWGVLHGVLAFVPPILATGEPGHVVNVASMAAVNVIPRLGPYTVAKHGVLGLSDTLRADLTDVGAPVGVSVVMPGRIKTRMNPIATRPPEVVAEAVVTAMRHDRPYVFTDQESADEVRARLAMIVDARRHVPTSDS